MSGDAASGIDNFTRVEIGAEEVMRANLYALLANLLRDVPDSETIRELANIRATDSVPGAALAELAHAAATISPEDIDDEFHALFVGVGGSELKPYASYYLTGFLYEMPLAKLRATMEKLGIAKAEDVAEPEDHIASVCEIMCGLIIGGFDEPAEIDIQRAFFDDHIAPWAERFFEDLETSETARFYRSVGKIGRLFMRIESQAFEMAA